VNDADTNSDEPESPEKEGNILPKDTTVIDDHQNKD
jgi:hypothetical protein